MLDGRLFLIRKQDAATGPRRATHVTMTRRVDLGAVQWRRICPFEIVTIANVILQFTPDLRQHLSLPALLLRRASAERSQRKHTIPSPLDILPASVL